MRAAFYAPLKPPAHPVPSGDRQMARLLITALERASIDVRLMSELRSHTPLPDPFRWDEIRRDAGREVERIARSWHMADEPPDLWFTYHNYYKAPDLLGPALARRFGLPYVIAEASHASRRAESWGDWQAAATSASAAADLHLCFTARDRTGIAPLLRPGAATIDLPPFIDDAGLTPTPRRRGGQPPVIATVAMMRSGDKLDSYRFLAAALAKLLDESWTLRVVGDGPCRAEVAEAFAVVPAERVSWLGQLDPAAVSSVLAQADLYAWPGFGEAFGLGYLEAQLAGLPVVALNVAGVSSVVKTGETGLLVDEAQPAAYADALRTMLRDPLRRSRMGEAATSWVRAQRTLGPAAATLGRALRTLVPQPAHAFAP